MIHTSRLLKACRVRKCHLLVQKLGCLHGAMFCTSMQGRWLQGSQSKVESFHVRSCLSISGLWTIETSKLRLSYLYKLTGLRSSQTKQTNLRRARHFDTCGEVKVSNKNSMLRNSRGNPKLYQKQARTMSEHAAG